MIWPSNSPYIFSLPSLPQDTEHAEQDPILGVCANEAQLPYAVITSRSIYIVNSKTNTIVNAHVRSQESIETYGTNYKIKRSHSGFNFIVQSSNNYLLVYSITDLQNQNSSSAAVEEVLSIYDKQQSNAMLQNGFPVSSSNGKDLNLKGFFSNLFTKSETESPNYDMSLRFKLVLKIQSQLTDFITLPGNQLLLVTVDPKLLQLVQLADSNNSSNIEVVLIDELDWYLQDRGDIREIHYVQLTTTLYWLNSSNKIWAVKVNQQQALTTSFQGAMIFESSKPIDKFTINQVHNLLYVVGQDCSLSINKLRGLKPVQSISETGKSLEVLTTIGLNANSTSKSTSSHIRNLAVSPCGSVLLLLFNNGWNIFSVFGNLNFSTFDHRDDLEKLSNDKKNWFQSMIGATWTSNSELIFVDNSKIYCFPVVKTNSTLQQNSLSLKRPILIYRDYISVFKGYEKPLNDYSSVSEVLNNRESELWYHIQLPTNFKLKNWTITSVTLSPDGQYVACCGNRDLIIYNSQTRRWKFLINDYHSNSFAEEYHQTFNNNILQTLWFDNHLILLLKADEHSKFGDVGDNSDPGSLKPTTEVLIFSNLIWNEDIEFNQDLCIWNYTFSNQEILTKKGVPAPRLKPKEDFLYFNMDNDNELIVLTTELNCYFFQISKTFKSKRSTLQLKCNKVFSLKRFFQSGTQNKLKFDPLSISSINKINANDLLILVNGEVIYLRQSLLEEDIASSFNVSTADLARIKSSSSITSLNTTAAGAVPASSNGSLAPPSVPLSPSQPQKPAVTENGRKRPAIKFEKIILLTGIEYLYKSKPSIISMFNGSEMIYYDMNTLANSRTIQKRNISKIEPLYVNIDDEGNYFGPRSDETANGVATHRYQKTHSNVYPFVTIWDQNCIIGFEVEPKAAERSHNEWFNFNRRSVRKDFLSSSIDYFLRIGDNSLNSLLEIHGKYSKFRNYQFCLEFLILNSLTADVFDSEFFEKLIRLVKMSSATSDSSEYVIYLSLLKKIEIKYWFKFFKEIDENPRHILMNEILPSGDYKLSSHYLILTLNYEKEKIEDQDPEPQLINNDDKLLILEILDKLVQNSEFETCFELIRYIKFMDQKNKLGLIDNFLSKHDKD